MNSATFSMPLRSRAARSRHRSAPASAPRRAPTKKKTFTEINPVNANTPVSCRPSTDTRHLGCTHVMAGTCAARFSREYRQHPNMDRFGGDCSHYHLMTLGILMLITSVNSFKVFSGGCCAEVLRVENFFFVARLIRFSHLTII